MKDAYTFDRDAEGLEVGYEKHIRAYDRIFERSGLDWYRVESDVGMMGGIGAHEYMAPCAAGEDDVALAPGYAANVEIASADAAAGRAARRRCPSPRWRQTPGLITVAAVAGALGVPAGALLKAFPVIVGEDELRLVMLRGDHRVNEIKLRNALGADVPARAAGGVRGADRARRLHRPGRHRRADPARRRRRAGRLRHRAPTAPTRTCAASSRAATSGSSRADVRTVEAGDTVDGAPIRIEPAIEVGNIFKLGTRYSEPLGATYLDEAGKERPIWMGSYGIGPARIAAAAVEQFADEHGICWPRSIAPFDVELVGLGKEGTRGARAGRAALRGAARRPGSTCSTTTATPARARSSPTPSCSACRCGSPSAGARSRPARSRRRCGAAASSAPCRSRARRRRRRTCGASLP